jgi:hypothetical protein
MSQKWKALSAHTPGSAREWERGAPLEPHAILLYV